MTSGKIILTFIFSLAFTVVWSQLDELQNQFDSLKTLTNSEEKAQGLNDLAWQAKYYDYDLTEEIANHSYTISKNNQWYNEAGMALKIKGILCDEKGLYEESIDYYMAAIEEYKLAQDTLGIAKCEGNIGIIYRNLKNPEQAEPYFRSSYRTFELYDFYPGMQICLQNLGLCKLNTNQNDSALFYGQKAKEIMELTGRMDPSIYGNLGLAYQQKGEDLKAKEYLEKAVGLYEENDPLNKNAKVWWQNLANLYVRIGENKKAVHAVDRALEITGENIYTREMTFLLATAANVYQKEGDYQKATEFYEELIHVKDSVYNIDNLSQIREMTEKYESEKKELEIQALNREKNIESLKREGEESKVFYLTLGGILAFLLLIWVAISLVFKSRDNKKIKEKNALIENQNEILEEKNAEITASIEYAKRIQTAILPPSRLVREYLNNSLIVYLPKDIVAGDFYWMDRIGDSTIYAVADCTGHGVPGAMVSVVCHNAMNRAVREFNLTSPGAILDKTTDLVLEQFEKSEEEVKDGMDIALCKLNESSVEYAGANNPLWIVRGEEIIEIKADKQPVGKFDKRTNFTTHKIDLLKGDTIYIFSDGYVDQFGGENGKKFKAKAMRSLLLSIQNLSMEEQREKIITTFNDWKADFEQVDDVCLIGIKI